MNTKLTIFFILTSSCILDSYAGSATWNLNPTNNSWGAASNWTPATVPNGSSDVATFDVSNTTAIDLGLAVKLDRMVFNPGASSFTFTVSEANLTINGLGIVNNSGVTHNFTNSLGSCTFVGTASAVDLIVNGSFEVGLTG